MASAIDDANSLPGETVNDQDGRQIGKVQEIYVVGEDKAPMWVTIKGSTGLGRSRLLFVPLARIKRENDEIRVPYSAQHVHSAPEIEPGEELSEEDDRALRDYYAIGLGDQEMRANSESYARLVPDGDGPATKAEGEAGEPQSGTVEGQDRDVDLKDPREAREEGKDDDEDGKIADPRDE
jgi:sporulation protein YlmC with PRC-barrel domain